MLLESHIRFPLFEPIMNLNTGKKLIVLLEKDFKNTLRNKNCIYKRQETILSKAEIKQETNYEFEYSNYGEEPKSESDDVVEIFANDIIDISDEDPEHPQESYKWEDDEWYKIVNVKQEGDISNNLQSNCMLANNEYTKLAILNEIEKTDKIIIKNTTQNVKVKGLQLSDDDNHGNDNLDPFAQSDDSDYIPEEDESDGGNIPPDEQLSSDTSEVYIDAFKDPNFGEKIKKKERKKKICPDSKNGLSEEEMKVLKKARFYVCSVCNLQLNKGSEKTPHRKSHGMRHLGFKKRFRCPKCLQISNTSHSFKVHYQNHFGKKIFTYLLRNCPYCPYKSSLKKPYKIHQLAHKVKSEFRCEFCSFSSTCKTVLTKHLKLHNKFPSGIYSCESCDFSTKLAASLRKHVKARHLPNEEKDWVHCPYCPFRALDAQNVKTHLKCHKQNKKYKCPQCTFSSDHVIRVKCHLKVHYDKEEDVPEYNPEVVKPPIIICPECPYKTRIPMRMKRHGLVHNDERIKCADCPFTCKDKADMIRHVHRHKKDAPLKCHWCSFRHEIVWAMTRHERLHFDKRLIDSENRKKELLRCPICKAIFDFPSQVKMHMTKHKTLDDCEDPVSCANCPFKSKSKDTNFIKHVLGHLKKDGIKCDFCTFRHDLKRVMTLHVRLHNNIKEEVTEDGESTPA